jgi:serine/threonine protein kinase
VTQPARWVCPECGASFGGPGACPNDGTAILPADDPFLGQTVGSYRITRLLGAGGMGKVYLGVQPSIGARVAIKLLSTDLGQNRELVERFFAEARAVNLIRHEQIINIIDLSFLPDGRPYIVMEFLEGAPLSSVIKKIGPLPLGTFAQLMVEVLGALDAAHARQIIHRDLKPDNIFVSPQGRATVLDFGIAKLDPGLGGQSGATRAGAIMGTPAYMAPEQAMARNVDARTDLYSLGIILFEGVTGRAPFESESLFGVLDQHINAPPPPMREARPELAPAYEAVILKALAKQPSERFASAGEMAAALAAAANTLGADAWTPIGIGRPATSQMAAITPMIRMPSSASLGYAPTVPPMTVPPTLASSPSVTSPKSNAWKWMVAGAVALVATGGGVTAALMKGGGAETPPVQGKAAAGPDAGIVATVTKPDASTKVTPPVGGPPRLSAGFSNQGYLLNFVFTRPPLEVQWRMAGDGEFRSTGQNPNYLDPATGEPTAKTWTMADLATKKGMVQVKYRTDATTWHGPYDLAFDPQEIAMREAREQLEMLPRWVEMREYDGKVLCYFTALVSHRDALTVIEYGFDKPPEKKLRFTPSEVPTREIVSDDELYVTVPAGTKQVTVRVTYRDGQVSETRKFDAPAQPGAAAPAADEPKPSKPGKGGLPSTGVQECDDVFRDALLCYEKIAPQATAQVTDGFRQTAQAIKDGIRQGAPKSAYVDSCKQIRESMKTLEQQGCKF